MTALPVRNTRLWAVSSFENALGALRTFLSALNLKTTKRQAKTAAPVIGKITIRCGFCVKNGDSRTAATASTANSSSSIADPIQPQRFRAVRSRTPRTMFQIATRTASVKPMRIDVFSAEVNGGKRGGIQPDSDLQERLCPVR